jgi:hypothetical protein
MAVVNRTLDPSEQKKVLEFAIGALATGITIPAFQVPFNSVLSGGQIAAFGLSGSPTYQLAVQRFIPGTGATAFTIGSANAPLAYGTSGAFGLSLPAAGSTLLNLLANDVLTVTSGASNAAVTGLNIGIVLRPLQDIKTQFGV